MKLSQGLAAVFLTMSAAVAQAEVTATVTATSDYDFRGITQTKHDPALQGSIDWAGDSGLYVGGWASNVDFGGDEDFELDLYAGFAGGETFPWDVGIIWYTYPQSNDVHDFAEIYASIGWKFLEGKVWYSNDFGGGPAGADAFYYEANANFELPANFGIGAHAGYSDGDYWGDDSYLDWSVGVTYTIGHFDLGLKYVDGSDLKDLDDYCKVVPAECSGVNRDIGSTDARAIFSVSTSFPWTSDEEASDE